MSSRKFPIVAVVGRPNVGKSTFFNRVLGKRYAIVEDSPGVTRDRIYAAIERFSVPFMLVDTGGFEKNPSDEITKQVVEQTKLAAEEADVVLVMFDGGAGLLEGDEDVMNMLRRYKKPMIFAVNKCDSPDVSLRTVDFYSLGVEELHDISALHNRNIEQIIDVTLKSLPNYAELRAAEMERRAREAAAKERARAFPDDEEEDGIEEEEPDDFDKTFDGDDESVAQDQDNVPLQFAPVYFPEENEMSADEYRRTYGRKEIPSGPIATSDDDDESYQFPEDDSEDVIPEYPLIKVALVGRPNVGKSTLLNTLCGEQRAITSPIAGTTRDVLDIRIKREGQEFMLIDTAGLRKRSRVDEKIEQYSALRSLGAIAECDVAVVMIDATEGPIEQDARIVGMAHEQGCGLVIAVNKWDLKEKDHRTVYKFTESVREAFKFAPYAPIIFTSALNGRRCPRVLDEAKKAAVERGKRIATGNLNRILRSALKRHTLPSYRGRPIKMYYGVQVDTAPPRFVLYFNQPRELHFSSLRYLKNEIRQAYGFVGTDIRLHAKKR